MAARQKVSVSTTPIESDEKMSVLSKSNTYSTDEGSDYIPEDKATTVKENNIVDVDNLNSVRRGRKRKKEMNKQTKNLELKNQGYSYQTYRGKGKIINKKLIGPNCNCKKKCFDIVSEADRTQIFNNFWNMNSQNIQNAYLFGCLTINDVNRKTKKTLPSRRKYTIDYLVVSDGEKKKICKKAFLNIHGLQNNRGRVENITKKMETGCKTPTVDRRGHHGNHKQKFSQQQLTSVRSFIDKLPKYQSHYSRNDNPKRMFMTMEYTIDSCYDVFKKDCSEKNEVPVSRDKFRRIFTEEYNITFKSPKTDSCSVCDSYNVSIKDAKAKVDDSKLNQLNTELKLHHKKAEAGQDAIKNARLEASINPGTYAITFDLQQVLPTPKLSRGPTFYKKKLFCYNFSIHCLYPTQGYFYMWDESTAGRGADEIGSCILKHFELNNIQGETLIAISDNCTGQNKNWSLVAVWLRLIALGYFKKIIHIFPQVGHTMLPSDRDFAVVENYVRAHCQFVYDPNEWQDILKKAQKKTAFKVYRMTQPDFLQISKMREYFQQPTTSSKSSFSIRNAVRLEISAENLALLHASDTYNGELIPISLKKRGRPTSFEVPFAGQLPLKYNSPIQIENSKLEHVLSCLRWIPSVYHEFYESLKPKINTD